MVRKGRRTGSDMRFEFGDSRVCASTPIATQLTFQNSFTLQIGLALALDLFKHIQRVTEEGSCERVPVFLVLQVIGFKVLAYDV